MTGYTKLFHTILASTIWRESKETKILWITMLAMTDRNGVVGGSIPGLADLARLTIPETEQALAELHLPDKYSRTQDHEGRRIETIDGGWRVLNHGKYREMMSADDRREYLRKAQQSHREKKRGKQPVNTRKQMSTMSTHTDTDTRSTASKNKINYRQPLRPSPMAEVNLNEDGSPLWPIKPPDNQSAENNDCNFE